MTFRYIKNQSSKEIQSVELLRGVAAMMVTFFHLSWGNERLLPNTSLVKQASTWGWAGVEIFFVISGFVIPYAMFQKNYNIKSFPVFLKKRIIRIEPPYLISIIVVIALNFVSTLSPYYRGGPFTIDWYNLVGHIAYLNIFNNQTWLNPVYWSLAIEFQYYLLIALAFTLIISGKWYFRLLFFAAFGALSFLPLPEGKFIFTYAGYFMMGILLFQLVCSVINKIEFALLLLLTGALLCYEHGAGLSFLTLSTMAVIAFLDRIPRVFRYLGHISYSLYLLHVPIGGRLINISESLIHNQFLRECMVFIAFLVCIGASSLFYHFIEKAFKKFSASIKYNNNPAIPDPALVVNKQ